MRQRIPPVQWLTSFEAVMRHRSMTHAATELRLTQGAVSQHIRKLEAYLDTLLFTRQSGQLHPSPQAVEYGWRVAEWLEGLDEATRQVSVTDAFHGGLHISVPTTFGIHWLIPRLSEFSQHYPDIQLHILNRDPNHPEGLDRIDISLAFASNNYRHESDIEIFQEYLIPVCTPSYAAKYPHVRDVKKLCDWGLIHIDERFDQTSELWIKQAAGIARPDILPGLRFERQSFALQAAKQGLGVTFTPEVYVDKELRSCELIKPVDIGVWSEHVLLARVPHYRVESARSAAFREWLKKKSEKYKLLKDI